MTLSVLTIVKARPAHLAELVVGLRRSGTAPKELIVVDMGSTPPVEVADLPLPVQVLRHEGSGLRPHAMLRLRPQAAMASCSWMLFAFQFGVLWKRWPRASRTSMLSSAGMFAEGFDEAFAGYGAEDTDFGFRAREADLPLVYMGGPGASHQFHDTFDPPLHHFQDIIRNARMFREKWKR